MIPTPDPVCPGQRSVWTFPRPAIAETFPGHVVIEHGGLTVADTRSSIRTLETSHPPSYYIPRDDIAPAVLRRADGESFCEWKGSALYWDVVVGDFVLSRAGWSYPNPSPSFALLRDHIAFYAAPFDRCMVDGQLVQAQPGAFTEAGSPPILRARSRACREAWAGERGSRGATSARGPERSGSALRSVRPACGRSRGRDAGRRRSASRGRRATADKRHAADPRQCWSPGGPPVEPARRGNEAWPDDFDGQRRLPAAGVGSGDGQASRQCPSYAAPAAAAGAGLAVGQRLAHAIRHFEPRPIAAASIGQVHRATTRDGRVLAIKVQYPGVRESIDADVDNVATLLRVSGLLPKELDIAPLLAEAKRQLAEEADYAREGAQMKLFGQLLADDPSVIVPELDVEFTTRNVLAMGFLEGQPIEGLETDPQELRNAVTTTLIRLVLRELFEFGVMQTDPNFANYRYQPDTGRLVLLDFGAARAVTPETARAYHSLLDALLDGDRVRARDAAVTAGFLGQGAVTAYGEQLDE